MFTFLRVSNFQIVLQFCMCIFQLLLFLNYFEGKGLYSNLVIFCPDDLLLQSCITSLLARYLYSFNLSSIK